MPDAAGFERFYRENLARIVRACWLVTLDRGRAEDLAAEAFARLWSHWGQIDGDDHAGGYVFTTAMRLCARDRSARRPALIAPAPPDELGRAADRLDVAAALATLPLRQRQAVVLRDWAGFGSREVAGMLRMRQSTLRVHLSRGRARLRELLRVDEGSPA